MDKDAMASTELETLPQYGGGDVTGRLVQADIFSGKVLVRQQSDAEAMDVAP